MATRKHLLKGEQWQMCLARLHDCPLDNHISSVICRLKNIEMLKIAYQKSGRNVRHLIHGERVLLDQRPGYSTAEIRRDRKLLKKHFVSTAKDVGESLFKQMREIISFYRNQYLNGQNAEKNVKRLAHTIRDWLPFVSYSTYVPLDRYDSSVDATPLPHPALEALAKLEQEYDDLEPLDGLYDFDLKGDSARKEVQDRAFKEAQDRLFEKLISYTQWRGMKDATDSDPRTIILANAGPVRDDKSFQKLLYDRDPILILIPKIVKPNQLVEILRMPTMQREMALRFIVKKAADYLEPALKAFKHDLGDDEIPWQRYKPLLETAKHVIFPLPDDNHLKRHLARYLTENPSVLCEYSSNLRMHEMLDQISAEIEPWTWRNTLNAALFIASLALTIYSFGISLSLLSLKAATLGIDLAVVGGNAYLNYLENEDRRNLNRFTYIDAALTVASPEMNLTDEIYLLAATYMAGPIIGSAARKSRRGYKKVMGIHKNKRRAKILAGEIDNADVQSFAARGISRPVKGQNEIIQQRGLDIPSPDHLPSQLSRRQAERATLSNSRNKPQPTSTTTRQLSASTSRGHSSTPHRHSEIVLNQRKPQRLTFESVETVHLTARQKNVFSILFDGETRFLPGLARQLIRKSNSSRTITSSIEADDILTKIATHWQNALRRSKGRGQRFIPAHIEVQNVWRKLLQGIPDTMTHSAFVRKHLFNPWRVRAMRSIGKDTKLRKQLGELGIIKKKGPTSPYLQLEVDTKIIGEGIERRKIEIFLDVDHADIKLEHAVEEALRTSNPDALISVIDAKNLIFRTSRENRHVLEQLRKQATHEAQYPKPTSSLDIDVDARVDDISRLDE